MKTIYGSYIIDVEGSQKSGALWGAVVIIIPELGDGVSSWHYLGFKDRAEAEAEGLRWAKERIDKYTVKS